MARNLGIQEICPTSLTYFGYSAEKIVCSIDRICDNFFSFDLALCKSKWIYFFNVRFYRARSARSETFHLYGSLGSSRLWRRRCWRAYGYGWQRDSPVFVAAGR